MCKSVGCDIFPIDVGVARDVRIFNRKIAYGTKNDKRACNDKGNRQSVPLRIGIEAAQMMKEKGYHILATGEMGIGNTTTSSAVASVLLDIPVERMTGRERDFLRKA